MTLMFKNTQVNKQFLKELKETIHNEFEDRPDITLIETVIVKGEYWSGILIEFNQNETLNIGGNDKTLNRQLQNIYDDFAEQDTRITGLSTGQNVYAISALKSLGEDYFETKSDTCD